jgi:hypothetical protein
VLCDAGGGTAVSALSPKTMVCADLCFHKDVVSYKVAQLEPILALEPLTYPTGMRDQLSTECWIQINENCRRKVRIHIH